MAGVSPVGVLTVSVGAVFMYGALTNRSPLSAFYAVVRGQSPSGVSQDAATIGGPVVSSTGEVSAGAQATSSQIGIGVGNGSAIDNAFKSWGWTRAGRAGAEANIQAESGGNTNNPGDGGTSNGIVQWHNDPPTYQTGRWANMVAYAHARGLSEFDLTAQLGFLKQELVTGYPDLYAMLLTSSDPAAVARYWTTRFERPANPDQQAAYRAGIAQQIYAGLT